MKNLAIPVFVCVTLAVSGAFAADCIYPDPRICEIIREGEQRNKIYEAHRKADEARHKESEARTERCIAGLDKLRIGMTEAEVNPIIDCTLFKVNTDQIVNHVRKQFVLYISPHEAIGYLYFDDGILTAIQRR